MQRYYKFSYYANYLLFIFAVNPLFNIKRKNQISRGKSGKFPEKAVSFRRRDMASTGKLTAFFGNLQQKSTASDEETSCLSSFQGCGARNGRPTSAKAAPTALRPEPTCLDLPCGIWGLLWPTAGRLLFRPSPPEATCPFAVEADLWSGKPFHHQGAMACHLHQCRMLEGQGVCSDSLYHTYGRRHTSGKHRHGSMTWVRRCGMSS